MSKYLSRVTETDNARHAAVATAEQAIRDAYTAGHTVTEIADVLGVKNRSRVYTILDKPGIEPSHATQIPPVVHLRTRKNHAHQALAQAMMARGWHVEADHMRAWHLTRAGVRVVMVDASAHLAADGVLQVGHIRAVHGVRGGHDLEWVSFAEYPTVEDGTKVARWVDEHMPTAVR